MDKEFLSVLPFYSAPGRFYHDFRHVARMFSDYQRNRNAFHLTDWQEKCLYYAILYHDVVYNVVPGGPSNEDASFEVFKTYVMLNDIVLDDQEMALIENMILSTEFHFTDENPFESGSIEGDYKVRRVTEILLDLDLMAFTDDYDSFVQTNKSIDKEFLTVYSTPIVEEGRNRFLRDILEGRKLKFWQMPKKEVLTEIAYRNIERYLTEQGERP